MSETYINPSGDQIRAIRDMAVEGPIVMVNLLRFAPDGGEERYRSYGQAAWPFLEKAGATVRFAADGVATVIGASDEDWDEIVLVEYPSKQAFLEMVGDPDYPSDIRTGAVLDSRLLCTQARPPQL